MEKIKILKKSIHHYAVILAGGQGSRFWPLSRSLEPKQFLSLITSKSLFHDTISRISALINPNNIIIVTNKLYFPEIFNYAGEFKIPKSNIIFEPEGKNTAASIAIASRLISLTDPQAKIAVLPSDHRIKNQREFNNLLSLAFSLPALDRHLVVFGVPAQSPATGYGYIKVKSKRQEGRGSPSTALGAGKQQTGSKRAYEVERFIEKPDDKKARRIFRDKDYFWNSGIFLGYANMFLKEIQAHLPHLYRLIAQINKPSDIPNIWAKIEPASFDYGVLEKSANLLVIPALNLDWSDLGSWTSLDKVLPKDKLANAVSADAVVLDSKNITLFGKSRLIACLGLSNLIVVDTPDALLITRKDKSEEVKKVVEALKRSNRQEVYLHKTVKRPWGSYTLLDKGLGFKVKLVEVLPKKTLSLQKHFQRSEHWVVVEGKAKITKGKKVYQVNSNESTFIPLRHVHRLENITNSPLKIVEVQCGDYLEEDDIIRIKDDFKRV